MEERTILIANTKTQQRHELHTSATTLGELKVAMMNAGIDYSGMDFTEGISKTHLLGDDTQLPSNVMFRGAPTNNLVMLLTNTTKNIASGCGERSRKEAYAIINEVGEAAKSAIQAQFGKNYTQVKTDILIEEIDAATKDAEAESPVNGNCNCHTCKALTELTSLLVQKDILSNEEGEAIVGELGTELKAGTASEYTKNELDEMFADM